MKYWIGTPILLVLNQLVTLPAAILYHADWEEGTGATEALITDGLYAYESSENGVVEVVAAGGSHPQPRSGKGMLYIEIDMTDGDFGCNGCKRIELKTDPFVRDMPFEADNGMSVFGDTYWYAWSVYVPKGQGPDGKRIMGQWVSRWQNGGYNEGGTMGLELANDRWNLALQRGRDPYRGRIIDLGPVAKGTWTDWVFQIRWDMDGYNADNQDGQTGFIRIWKNGNLRDDNNDGFTDTGVNCFHVEDADEAPFLKFGVYKGSDRLWVPERHIAYYDELRIGDSRATYAEMAPGGDGPAPTPSIVISPSRISVPEGATQTLFISLTAAPPDPLTLEVTREGGDADLRLAGGGILSFSPDNWNQPRRLDVEALPDSDALNGTATFRLTGSGVLDGVFTAMEEDRDSLDGEDALAPIADTFVRGGDHQTENYGTDAILRTKDGSGEAYDREIFLKFDLSALQSDPSAAVLILRELSTTSGSFTLYASVDDGWTETGLTWNSPQRTKGVVLQNVPIHGSGDLLQLDVTQYIRSERTGDGVAGFVIRADGDYWVDFASRETGEGPRLAFSFDDGSTWAGFPMDARGNVDTGNWLEWLSVAGDYAYAWTLNCWLFLPESHVSPSGAWAYVMNP